VDGSGSRAREEGTVAPASCRGRYLHVEGHTVDEPIEAVEPIEPAEPVGAADGAGTEAGTEVDLLLLRRARAGDPSAFAELYERYHGVATSVARRSTASLGTAEVDDIVADAFLAVEQAIGNGHGPTRAFLPYLLTVVRHRAVRARADHDRSVRLRARLEAELVTEVPDVAAAGPAGDAAAADGPGLDPDSLLARAYRILPERWQRVLWLSEVEGRPVRAWAGELGLGLGAASALAYRARRALRDEYLRAYGSTAEPDCRGSVGELQRLAALPADRRGAVLTRATAGPTAGFAHVTSCARCRDVLRGIERPGVALGVTAATSAPERATPPPAPTEPTAEPAPPTTTGPTAPPDRGRRVPARQAPRGGAALAIGPVRFPL